MDAAFWFSVVGTVTGVAGAVMGWISYQEVRRLKALDLRLELRRLEGDTTDTLRELPELLHHAQQSRVHVAAALGSLGTGAIEGFKQQVATDLSAIHSLATTFTPALDYASLTHEQLEARLVVVHRLKQTVARYVDTYNAALAKDDKDREYIRSQWKP